VPGCEYHKEEKRQVIFEKQNIMDPFCGGEISLDNVSSTYTSNFLLVLSHGYKVPSTYT
jgi:hypothetical protein